MEDQFFSENYSVFEAFKKDLERYSPESEIDKQRVKLTLRAIDAINSNRALYDRYSSVSAERTGERLLEMLRREIDGEMLRRILFFLAQFVREVSLLKSERTSSEQEILNHFIGEPDWSDNVFDGFFVDFIRYQLPFDMLMESQKKAGLDREEILKIRNSAEKEVASAAEAAKSEIGALLEKSESDIKALKESHFGEIDQLEQRIAGYRDSIRNLASDYNFVALSHAFKKLIEEKTSEKWWSAGVVSVLGILAITLPVASLLLKGVLGEVDGVWNPHAVARLLAAAGIELVLLYFFRVALRSYLLTRSQITNLQLRLSLCAFIEGYRDFARSSGNSESVVLDRFESLIFGQLPALDGNLPPTIDGLEHVSSILQNLKKA